MLRRIIRLSRSGSFCLLLSISGLIALFFVTKGPLPQRTMATESMALQLEDVADGNTFPIVSLLQSSFNPHSDQQIHVNELKGKILVESIPLDYHASSRQESRYVLKAQFPHGTRFFASGSFGTMVCWCCSLVGLQHDSLQCKAGQGQSDNQVCLLGMTSVYSQ